MSQGFSAVGKEFTRVDVVGHVTATTQFVDDISFPGMLWVKAVRSPVSRGRIRRLDVSKARGTSGVVTVLTGQDVPRNLYTELAGIGVGPPDEPILASEEVNYKGEPICIIVAEDEYTAMKAASRVEVDVDELPPVLSLEEALKPSAPVIKKWGSNTFTYGSGTDGATQPGGPGRPYFLLKHGDVDKAFAQSEYIIEGKYSVQPIEHSTIEPHVCVAKPEVDGRITVYSPSQAPYFTRDNIETILNVPPGSIRVVGGTVGGAFGGKVDPDMEAITALAALKTGRPVKWRWTREEEFYASSTRQAAQIEFKDGVTKDGYIIARKARYLHDAGAYSRTSPYGVMKSIVNIVGPYHIPNVWAEGYCVYTNRQPSSAMRGYGVWEVSFAIEVQMERIARSLGMDSWEFRFKNAYRNNQIAPTGRKVRDASMVETMKAAAELAGYRLGEHLLKMTSWDWEGER